MIETKTLVGQVLGQGRYHVKRKLGEGGMAYVLLAYDQNVGIDVVLKVPKAEVLADPEFAFRFKREIRSMVELTHPHIVKIKDVGEQDGVPFYVMDLLTGGSLEDRFTTTEGVRKPQPPESLTVWLEPVARALDFIHKRFVHRDIKPANILFDAAGNAFVSDFGIVKAIADGADQSKQTQMTQAGMVVGTCSYIAPEVTEGKKYDGRADQYALAATVYEVLSTRVPFEGATLPAIIMQQLTGKVLPLQALSAAHRRSLTPVIEKGLSRDPKDRYPSCEIFAKAILAGIQAAPPLKAPGPPPLPQLSGKHSASTSIVCPECKRVLALPPNSQAKWVTCPACQIELPVPGKTLPLETIKESRPKAQTRVVERNERAKTSRRPTVDTERREEEAPRSRRRLILIVVALVAAIGIVGAIAAVALLSGGGGGTRSQIMNSK